MNHSKTILVFFLAVDSEVKAAVTQSRLSNESGPDCQVQSGRRKVVIVDNLWNTRSAKIYHRLNRRYFRKTVHFFYLGPSTFEGHPQWTVHYKCLRPSSRIHDHQFRALKLNPFNPSFTYVYCRVECRPPPFTLKTKLTCLKNMLS